MRLDIILDWKGMVVEDSWGHWGHRGHGGRGWAGEGRVVGELHGQHPLTPDVGRLVAHRVPGGKGGGEIVALIAKSSYNNGRQHPLKQSIATIQT